MQPSAAVNASYQLASGNRLTIEITHEGEIKELFTSPPSSVDRAEAKAYLADAAAEAGLKMSDIEERQQKGKKK